MTLRNHTRLVACGLVAAAVATSASADSLFVSNWSGGQVHRFDLPSNIAIPIVSGLSLVEGGACSPSGLIYFAESLDGRITRYAPDGSGATNIVPAAGNVPGAEGLSFDAAGNLYINQRQDLTSGCRIWRLDGGDPTNVVVPIQPPFTTFGEGTNIVRGGPHQGALLYVDNDGHRVLLSEPPGSPAVVHIPATSFPPTARPIGVTTNTSGEIFVAVLTAPSDVLRYDPDGTFLEVYGTGLSGALFLDFDSSDNLYVTDGDASTIWMIRPDRTRSPFALLDSVSGLAICRCAAPTATAAAVPPHCEGTGSVTLDGSASGPCLAGTRYRWTDGALQVCPWSASPTCAVSPSVTTTYTLEVACADAPNCLASTAVPVTVTTCTLTVMFESFAAAVASGGGIEVCFVTRDERDTIAFQVERAASPDAAFAATDAPLPARGAGASYRLTDPTGTAASWYRVVEVSSDGRGTTTPPFRAAERGGTGSSGRRRRHR